MAKVQTEDQKFLRDIHSKGLINTDRAALAAQRANRRRAKSQLSERDQLHARVEALEARVQELERLVRSLQTHFTRF